jgi:hypothetical protein
MLYANDVDYYMDYLKEQDEIMCMKIHRRKPSLFYNIGFITFYNTNNPKCNTTTPRCARGENIFDMRYICYSPYGHKELFSGTGTAHMGNFSSPGPFRHGDSPPYGYGDWCFCLPLSQGCASAPPKILAKKLKFPTLPLRVMGIHKSPYRNGDSPFPYGD